MQDSTRIPPGHPSDSSRVNRPQYGGSTNVPPANYNYPPATPPPPHGSYNPQTRNIIIGAIATIIASTTVYYLTQYVNTRKTESAPSFADKKEATVNGWKRYVTIDNIYYKSMLALAADKQMVSNLDNYRTELSKLTDDFLKESETFVQDKSLDKLFVTMVNRRIKKEKESREKTTAMYNDLKAVATSTLDSAKKVEKVISIINNFRMYSRLTLEISATEIEDLSKALVGTFGGSFDPNDFLIYADYKKGKFNLDPLEDHPPPDTSKAARNIDPNKLIGKWHDEDNYLELGKDGSMSYTLESGEKGIGTWKIEDHKLRVDGVISASQVKTLQFFRLYNITKDSFMMQSTVHPHEEFMAVRIKDN